MRGRDRYDRTDRGVIILLVSAAVVAVAILASGCAGAGAAVERVAGGLGQVLEGAEEPAAGAGAPGGVVLGEPDLPVGAAPYVFSLDRTPGFVVIRSIVRYIEGVEIVYEGELVGTVSGKFEVDRYGELLGLVRLVASASGGWVEAEGLHFRIRAGAVGEEGAAGSEGVEGGAESVVGVALGDGVYLRAATVPAGIVELVAASRGVSCDVGAVVACVGEAGRMAGLGEALEAVAQALPRVAWRRVRREAGRVEAVIEALGWEGVVRAVALGAADTLVASSSAFGLAEVVEVVEGSRLAGCVRRAWQSVAVAAEVVAALASAGLEWCVEPAEIAGSVRYAVVAGDADQAAEIVRLAEGTAAAAEAMLVVSERKVGVGIGLGWEGGVWAEAGGLAGLRASLEGDRNTRARVLAVALGTGTQSVGTEETVQVLGEVAVGQAGNVVGRQAISGGFQADFEGVLSASGWRGRVTYQDTSVEGEGYGGYTCGPVPVAVAYGEARLVCAFRGADRGGSIGLGSARWGRADRRYEVWLGVAPAQVATDDVVRWLR